MASVLQPDHDAGLGQIQTVSCDDWRAVVRLCGEFDLGNAHRLRDELAGHVRRGRTVIRVDLDGVQIIDSAAPAAIVHGSTQCRVARGSLILTNVPARVLRVLQLAGLDTVLVIHTPHPDPATGPAVVTASG